MKLLGAKTALAATLGLMLAGGDAVQAQGKRDRDRKNQPQTQPGKRDVPRGKANGPRGKADVPRGKADGPRGKVDVPRGKADGPRGKNTRPPVRVQPKRGNPPNRGVQPNRGNRGAANVRAGRRWNQRDLRNNRGDYFRLRSGILGSGLRIGVGPNGVRVGVGSRRGYDWRNWRNDHYARHRWYRGSWNGAWYGRFDNRWQRSWRGYPAAIAFGITPWGLNRTGYWFGYNQYTNPYYYQPVVIGSTTIDYSQPLVAVPAENDTDVTIADLDRARDAFKREKYQQSLNLVNRALAEHPRDATLHEFRALALFALADYRQAAQTLNPVLAVGPGWDWATLRGLYSSVAEYTKHLRALESYVGDHKDKAYPHFLLAYHYLTAGHEDAARKQLQRTVALAPKDDVSRQLLNMLDQNAKIETPARPSSADDARLAVDDLLGAWNAKRGSSEFGLKLAKDMSFTWTHRDGKRTTKVTGVYAIHNGTLALEPQAGGVMLANIDMQAKDRMRFRMVGSGAKDGGLTFTR